MTTRFRAVGAPGATATERDEASRRSSQPASGPVFHRAGEAATRLTAPGMEWLTRRKICSRPNLKVVERAWSAFLPGVGSKKRLLW
jgi:hypothetical protein